MNERPVRKTRVMSAWLLTLKNGKIEPWCFVGRLENLMDGEIVLLRCKKYFWSGKHKLGSKYVIAIERPKIPGSALKALKTRATSRLIRKLLDIPYDERGDFLRASMQFGSDVLKVLSDVCEAYPNYDIRKAISFFFACQHGLMMLVRNTRSESAAPARRRFL